MMLGAFARGSRRLRSRVALVIVSATTGIASIAVMFMDGHTQLFVVLTAISIGAGAAEWGLR
jgi:hypothetical protein